MPVPGCPISVTISGGISGPQVSLAGPGPVHSANSLVINHNGGRLEDIEVNVEGKIRKFNGDDFVNEKKNSFFFFGFFFIILL